MICGVGHGGGGQLLALDRDQRRLAAELSSPDQQRRAGDDRLAGGRLRGDLVDGWPAEGDDVEAGRHHRRGLLRRQVALDQDDRGLVGRREAVFDLEEHRPQLGELLERQRRGGELDAFDLALEARAGQESEGPDRAA